MLKQLKILQNELKTQYIINQKKGLSRGVSTGRIVKTTRRDGPKTTKRSFQSIEIGADSISDFSAAINNLEKEKALLHGKISRIKNVKGSEKQQRKLKELICKNREKLSTVKHLQGARIRGKSSGRYV